MSSARRRRTAIALAAWSGLMVATKGSQAQVRELRWDPAVDGTVTIVGGALWLTSVVLQPLLAPSTCRWCRSDPLDVGVRDTLRWRDPRGAEDLSDVAAFAVVPSATLGLDALAASHDHAPRGVGLDALLVLEATVMAADVNELTKLLAGC
jgi:hypothetical protein